MFITIHVMKFYAAFLKTSTIFVTGAGSHGRYKWKIWIDTRIHWQMFLRTTVVQRIHLLLTDWLMYWYLHTDSERKAKAFRSWTIPDLVIHTGHIKLFSWDQHTKAPISWSVLFRFPCLKSCCSSWKWAAKSTLKQKLNVISYEKKDL